MIMRTWRGWTRPEDADAYAQYIAETGIAEYEATPGNRGAYLVSRRDGNRTEFMTVSFWDDHASIVAFAGEDIDQAVFYPDDDRFLVDPRPQSSISRCTEPGSGERDYSRWRAPIWLGLLILSSLEDGPIVLSGLAQMPRPPSSVASLAPG